MPRATLKLSFAHTFSPIRQLNQLFQYHSQRKIKQIASSDP